MPNRKRQQFYCALGRFVSEWATVELFLDLIALTLRTSEAEIPHQLSKKLNFIRKKAAGGSVVHNQQLLVLLKEIESIADTRHDYVHGAVIGDVVERHVLTVSVGRLLQPPNKPRRKTAKVTAKQIADTAKQLYDIWGQLLEIADSLNQARKPRLN